MARRPVVDADLEVEDEPIEGDEDQGGDAENETPEDDELDEGEVEEDDEPEDDEGERQPVEDEQPQSRGRNAVQRAKDAAKAERDRADKAEQELAELRQRATQTTQPRETAEQRQARLAAMDPEERLETLRQEDRQVNDARFNQLQFTLLDQNDQHSFNALCSDNPNLRAIKGDVDKELQRLRASGANSTRETVAYYLLGKRAASRAGSATNKQRKAADAAKRTQSARPSQSRSDTRSEGRGGRDNEKEARRKRLENMDI